MEHLFEGGSSVHHLYVYCGRQGSRENHIDKSYDNRERRNEGLASQIKVSGVIYFVSNR